MSKIFDQLRLHGQAYPRLMSDIKLAAAFVQALPADWSPAVHRAFQDELAFADIWVRNGEIVYELAHSLAAMFVMTSAPMIEWDRLPHPAFVIKVPRAFLPLPGTIEPEYSYIYVCDCRALIVSDWDATAYLSVKYPRNPSRESLETIDTDKVVAALREARVDRESVQPQIVANMQKIAQMRDLPRTILDRIAEEVVDRVEVELIETADALPHLMTPAKRGTYALCSRFIGNLLAHIANSPPSKRPTQGHNAGSIINIGMPRDIIVDRAFRDAAKDTVAAIQDGSIIGVRRVLAHYVRGHWRNQPIGTGRTERRRTWIHPHRRGDETLGSVVRRIEHLDIPKSEIN